MAQNMTNHSKLHDMYKKKRQGKNQSMLQNLKHLLGILYTKNCSIGVTFKRLQKT